MRRRTAALDNLGSVDTGGPGVLRQLKGTNAHKYVPAPCLLTLEVNDGAVAVTVWDSSAALPLILPPDPTWIGQHGLDIVLTLCRSFEIYREPVGKSIRAAVVLADDPDGDPAGLQPM